MNLLRRKKLGVSWVQGELHVALVIADKFIDGWHAPAPVNDLSQFNMALAEAVLALDAQEADISFVYESEVLSHPYLQVPPLSNKDLLLYLQQRVNQDNEDGKPQLFTYRKSLSSHDKQGVLLHVIEENFLDVLVRICSEFHLYPITFVPLSAIMQQEMFRFEVAENEVILMVALFDHLTEILVVRGDGETLFLRDLGYATHSGSTERITTEIKRSMLYANQQFMMPVQRICLIGLEAEGVSEAIKGEFDLPVECAKDNLEQYFWAYEVSMLSRTVPNNLLPLKHQFKRSSRQMRLTTAGLLAALVTVAVMMFLEVEYLVWSEKPEPQVIDVAMEKALSNRDALAHQVEERRTIDARLSQLTAGENAPVSAWFLSQLPSLISHPLVLKDVWVKREGGIWNFVIVGQLQGAVSDAPAALEIFEKHIQAGEIQARVTRSWSEGWFDAIRLGGVAVKKTVEFRIEGTL
ncbi:MAG: hypothetical protein AUK35_05085 [Zetaproteobacteria bacterium CG2_30_46_52]|nr:MAG: hypothetical protein AUK35_05085 [Zetaproteobacteria bacterium CG2_30_46_52]